MFLPDRSPEPDNLPSPATVTVRYRVRALAEASVLSRLIELFALRDIVPHEVNSRLDDAGELRIEIAVRGLEPRESEHICRRMMQVMPVIAAVATRE